MQRTRVKICGITRVEDGLVAARSGADAVGLVFYPPSVRAVDVDRAREIVAALPPFVTSVGLFVDESPERVRRVLAEVPLGLLQFHGQETPEYCASFARPYVKALRMKPDLDVLATARSFSGASGILLDTYVPGRAGGTGERFDWERVPGDLGLPLVLAGGLRPDNVARAVTRVRPYAVDVSGGVESAPGIKDPDKIEAFIRGVSIV